MADTAPAINSPRILLGYPYYPSATYADVQESARASIRRLRAAGFDVEGFCLTLNPPANCLTFAELDRRWRRGDRDLLTMYEQLEERLRNREVLLNQAGINLHPEFVKQLGVFTVFQCFDDPENSANLSRPVAPAYDLCLVGNIAEVETYRSWGVPHAEWMPLGFTPDICDPTLTYEQILEEHRDIGLFMMIDRLSPWRKSRLDQLAAAFPEAHFYGRGWPRGYLPAADQGRFLRRARIGPNLHNSTGPINYRTYYLPANGVLQICDNKRHLGAVFALDREAVGFDTIEEGMELCRYYLAHESEGRRIAAEGWRRAHADYSEVAVFRRAVELINRYRPQAAPRATAGGLAVVQRQRTRWRNAAHVVAAPGRLSVRGLRRATRHLANRIRRRLDEPNRGSKPL